ncbi:hypothetical protein SXCC_03001 [Gluconacetobacter sp. SXCC-1]|nr:hypothetical protein SXCC_03001 [Gluconacetobacter sp. SXCC-1]
MTGGDMAVYGPGMGEIWRRLMARPAWAALLCWWFAITMYAT